MRKKIGMRVEHNTMRNRIKLIYWNGNRVEQNGINENIVETEYNKTERNGNRTEQNGMRIEQNEEKNGMRVE
jgi:hypothetical protein